MKSKIVFTKKILLILCLCLLAAICIGCAEKLDTSIKVRSSSTADYTISVGMDDEMLNALADMSETTTDDIIQTQKDGGYTYTTETIDGVLFHVFTKSGTKAKFSKIENELKELGYTNVCMKKDYFYATYTASDLTTDDSNMTTTDGFDYSDFKYYQKISVQLNSKVKRTNGKINSANKRCVTWTHNNHEKSKNFYASTSATKKNARIRNLRNGKTYKIGKAGKKIKIANASYAARIQLNGKTIKNGKVIKKAGTYTLSIWNKSGKFSTIKFTITK